MKTVLSGVALAAILALAMPAWAQGTDAQQQNAPQPNAPQASAPMSHAKKAHATQGTHARKVSHKNTRHVATRKHGARHYAANKRPMYGTTTARLGGQTRSPTDHLANQLNRSENQRLTGSSTPPMGNPNMGAAGNQNMGNPNMAPMGTPKSAASDAGAVIRTIPPNQEGRDRRLRPPDRPAVPGSAGPPEQPRRRPRHSLGQRRRAVSSPPPCP